jgi:hypothetical protein
MIGQSILRHIPIGRHNEEEQILARLRAGERSEHYETIRLTKDAGSQIIGASKIAHDTTERKQAASHQRAASSHQKHARQRAGAGSRPFISDERELARRGP